VSVSLIKFQGLILGTNRVIEELATARRRRLISRAMENKNRQGNEQNIEG
jgi:hypothetical protein